MRDKILAFGSMLLSLGTAVVLAIPTFAPEIFPYRMGQIIFVWIAAIAIFLMSLRFNIVGLRHDMLERMRMPNTGLILVSLFLYYVFLRHFLAFPGYVQYIVIGGLIACFAIVFIVYWVRNRRGSY